MLRITRFWIDLIRSRGVISIAMNGKVFWQTVAWLVLPIMGIVILGRVIAWYFGY